MPAPPSRSAISGTPTRATANTGFGAFWDYVTGLLGATGNASDARAALGVVAASTTVAGLSELATSAEAPDRTKTAVVLTPATLRDALVAQNDAPIYACRGWANFNGTGTVAIRASGNVSSITDNGTGTYTANLIAPMPDANAAVLVTADSSLIASTTNIAAGSVSVACTSRIDAGGLTDSPTISIAIFR